MVAVLKWQSPTVPRSSPALRRPVPPPQSALSLLLFSPAVTVDFVLPAGMRREVVDLQPRSLFSAWTKISGNISTISF